MTKQLYTFSINVKTGEIQEHVDEDYDEDGDWWMSDESPYEVACYNDFAQDTVYVESLVSMAEAKRIAREKCVELRDGFDRAIDIIDSEK